MSLYDKIATILKQAAESENLTNYEVIPDLDTIRGDGFLSEFHSGDIKNKDTNELMHVYIKVPPFFEPFAVISEVFSNEYNFYAKIFPELLRFQVKKGLKNVFDKIPKFYCGSLEEGNKYLALENLKTSGYVMTDKTKFLDENLLETLFETYGHYHALTFAFKDQNAEKYAKLIQPVNDIFPAFSKTYENMKEVFKLAADNIKLKDEQSAARIRRLLDDFPSVIERGTFYKGKYSSLVHGDCWSNNMLFKYDKNQHLTNLLLIDHQLLRDSTPVHDLSYFFYSGASKRDFDNLEFYLDIYYKSFKKNCQELGSDPEKLLPFDALKSDWKKYAIFGVFMGVMIWQGKLMPKSDILDVSMDQNEKSREQKRLENLKKVFQNPVFIKNVSDILLHAIEYDII